MKIGEYIKQKQPKEYEKLMKKERKQHKKQEHLSFYDIEELMGVHEQVLKKKRGAYRRVR